MNNIAQSIADFKTQTKMTVEQELAALRAENEALKKSRAKGLHFKVGKAGGIVVSGLGRHPVTLYLSQWDIFMDESNITALRAFIAANRHLCKTKEQVGSDQVQDDVSESA